VRRQTVAVLFADVVGVTRMSEAVAPEAVVAMLRQLHDRMTAQVFASNGSIEKYAGDEVFAVSGIPEAGPNDAADAFNCAMGMLDALADWNRERVAAGDPPLALGIGINYGPAVFGDIGSEQSLASSVIGDTVNSASRLQGLTRNLQTPLVVSDAVVAAATSSDDAKALAALPHLRDRGRAGAARPHRARQDLDLGRRFLRSFGLSSTLFAARRSSCGHPDDFSLSHEARDDSYAFL